MEDAEEPAGAGANAGRARIPVDAGLFPWFRWVPTNFRTVNNLRRHGILMIEGNVRCRKCGYQGTVDINLQNAFRDIEKKFENNEDNLHQRAPPDLVSNNLLRFGNCKRIPCLQHRSVEPLIPEDNANVNWLFLFLRGLLGCCSVERLKWFCEKTGNFVSGTKDKLLYLCYVTMGRMLNRNPERIFNRIYKARKLRV